MKLYVRFVILTAPDEMLTGVWQHDVPGRLPDSGAIGPGVHFALFNLAWLLGIISGKSLQPPVVNEAVEN